MAVITMSRELGTRGIDIAARAAELLGYEVVDKRLITEVAQAANVPEHEVEQFDEQEESGIKAFLLGLLFAEGMKGTTETYPSYTWAMDFPYQVPLYLPPQEAETTEEVYFLDRAQYLQFTQATIRRLYQHGNVIIVGRGGMMVLRDLPGVLHVRVFASEEFRAEVVMAAEDIDYQAALKKIRLSDRRRAAYLRRHYHVQWDDPSLYHLLINAERVTVETAAHTIAAAAKSLEAKRPAAPSQG